ncbi:MAG: stage III sporulation protein AD [Clostridia bacterium]|nr:stage III sporulation protein AD [Clostridia bacterium]
MDIFKIVGVGIIALTIVIILKQYRPEFAIYGSIIAGVIIIIMLSDDIKEMIGLINDIAGKTNINTQFVKILIKITGIAILTEFAVSICNDSGEGAIANKIDVGGKVLIMCMSIPIIHALMETVLRILP